MRHPFALLGILLLTPLGCIVTTNGGAYSRAYAGGIPLTLINDTGVPACYVHMSPSNDHNWGDDWLGPTEVIQPGNSRTFMVGGGPGWDVQVQNCQHLTIAEAQRIPVMSGMQVPISALRGGAVVQQQPVYVQPQQQGTIYVQPQGGYAAPPPVYVR